MPNPLIDEEPMFVSGDTLCQRYSITRSTLKRLTDAMNSPPHVTIGLRIIRYDAVAFDAWFRSHSVGNPVLEDAASGKNCCRPR